MSGGISTDMESTKNPRSAECRAESGSWHQTLVEEVARRAECRAEELERRFRERMETTLSFELAKIERVKHCAAGLPLGQREGEVIDSSTEDQAAQEPFKRLNYLRNRYQQQMQGLEKAQLSSDQLRVRLSRFYERICPAKLPNVPRIVNSFEARGGTSQALWDLNSELLAAYGNDLDSMEFLQSEAHAYAQPPPTTSPPHTSSHNPTQILPHSTIAGVQVDHVPSQAVDAMTAQNASTTRPALQERLAMLSDEALVEARHANLLQLPSDKVNTESNDVPPGNLILRNSPPSTLPDHRRLNAWPFLGPSSHHRGEQVSHQVSHKVPTSTEGNDNVFVPRSNFVGMPSPRWAGNASGQARAKYPYTAKHADELSLSVGDVVHVTGKSADGWLWGYCNGFKGLLPANFVAMIPTDPSAQNHDPRSTSTAENLPAPVGTKTTSPPQQRTHRSSDHHLRQQQLQALQSLQQRQHVYCPAGHVMLFDSDGRHGWCCDLCRCPQSPGARRLQCKECNYDVCDGCNPKRTQFPATQHR